MMFACFRSRVVSHRLRILGVWVLVSLTCLSSAAHANEIAYVATNAAAIFKSDLDGSNESVVSSFPGAFAAGIEFDALSRQVFFSTNQNSGRINRIDLDGSNGALAATDSTAFIQAIAVNTSIDKLAWVRTGGTASNLFIRNVSGGGGAFLFSESSSSTTIQESRVPE